MLTERPTWLPKDDIGRSPDACNILSWCFSFFQVTEGRRPIKRKDIGDSSFAHSPSSRSCDILSHDMPPVVHSLRQLPGYSGYSGSIHTGQLLSETGSAHLRQISMSSGSSESASEVGFGSRFCQWLDAHSLGLSLTFLWMTLTFSLTFSLSYPFQLLFWLQNLEQTSPFVILNIFISFVFKSTLSFHCMFHCLLLVCMNASMFNVCLAFSTIFHLWFSSLALREPSRSFCCAGF